jgi:hypothetical protein
MLPFSNHHEGVVVSLTTRQKSVDVNVRVETQSDTDASFQHFLRQYLVRRIQIKVASHASTEYPIHSLDLNRNSNTTVLSRGAAGVTVVVEFNNVCCCSDHEQHHQFRAVLTHLHQRRVLLASSASVHVPRLFRFVRIQNATGAEGCSYTLLLPTDGAAALSVEGMVAFAGANQDAFCISGGSPTTTCLQEAGGVWSVADALTWSNWMLGVVAEKDKQWTSGQRRGLWMEWQSTSEGMGLFSQGVHYTKRIPRSLSSKIDISLSDITPTSFPEFKSFPLAESTRLQALMESPSQLEWTKPACRNDDRRSGDFSICELAGTTPVHEALMRYTVDSTTPTVTPLWSVDLNVLRPVGLANRGRFISTVRNDHTDCEVVHVNVFQRIPAIVQPLWRSLVVSLTVDDDSETLLSWVDLDEHDIQFLDSGAVDLVFGHILPVHSQLILSLDYNPLFLSLDAFPGDPNRGLELPPLTAMFHCDNHPTVELTSDTVLLLPPVPDLSMPFNVLSLTCTLYVFVIGSALNILIRRASQAIQKELLADEDKKPSSKLTLLLERFGDILRRVKLAFVKDRGRSDETSAAGKESTSEVVPLQDKGSQHELSGPSDTIASSD